jgi:hypothetical protein
MSWRLKSFAFLLLFFVVAALVENDEPGASKPLMDLGTAQYPPSTRDESPYRTTVHAWAAKQLPSQYRIAYVHGEEAIANLHADHAGLARRFGYRVLDKKRFSWNHHNDCRVKWRFDVTQSWACVYSEILERSIPDLNPLLIKIKAGFEAQTLTSTEATRWLLALVQTIPYRIPEHDAFGVLPPALVASENWGDCDSKSLLLIYLLRRLGMDAQLLVSAAHSHAMVGIALPYASSDQFEYAGRIYTWAETTSKAPLGWIDPRMRTPDDWRLVPVAAI